MALYRRANPTNTAAKFFDIRLDQDVVLLRGSPNESSSASLKGTVVLCLLEPLSLKKIKISVRGTRKLGWVIDGSTPFGIGRKIKHVNDIWNKDWTLWDLTGQKQSFLEPGNYEYPFEVIFDADTAESVEGLPDSWIVYRLRATIERGRLAQNVYTHRHIRVVRSLALTSLEIATSAYLEGIWHEKVKYNVATASKAVVLGTPVHFEINLMPLLKGLMIDHIYACVTETQDLNLGLRSHKIKKHVAEIHFPHGTVHESLNDEGEECWNIKDCIQLPTSLVDCVQDVDRAGITVTHHLKIFVSFANPDGHKSIVRVRIPIIIYISPNVMLNESNQITNSAALSRGTSPENDLERAPPMYGAHRQDQPWRGIDPRGYMTPADTSSASVSPEDGRSRSGSSEDLLEPAASSTDTHSTLRPSTTRDTLRAEPAAYGTLAPGDLRQRLSDLPDTSPRRRSRPQASRQSSEAPSEASSSASSRDSETESSRPSVRSSGYFPPVDTPATPPSGTRSRASVADDVGARPAPASPEREHVEFDQESLAKVPSYQTAIRAPARTPVNRDLPDYNTATGTTPPAPAPAMSRRPSQDTRRQSFRRSLQWTLPR